MALRRQGRHFYPDMLRRLPTLVRRAAAGATMALAACADSGSPAGGSPTDPGGTTPPAANTITVNNATLKVAIAATNAARTRGLTGVTTMAADSAMLFVFADDRQRGFWMKDTPIPLSIAFLDANRRIIFLSDMAPNTTTVVGGLNVGAMRYAIEVNQGWFVSHAVTVGMTASFTLPSGLVVEPEP